MPLFRRIAKRGYLSSERPQDVAARMSEGNALRWNAANRYFFLTRRTTQPYLDGSAREGSRQSAGKTESTF
jgi:hypothetical protein